MATTTSNFVSQFKLHQGRIDCPKQYAYVNKGTNGLRSFNCVDMLQLKNQKPFNIVPSSNRGTMTKTYAVSKPVMCVSVGMSLVFVSAEVAPWSKTGGLGDVLGGLPPVMAVSTFSVLGIMCKLLVNVRSRIFIIDVMLPMFLVLGYNRLMDTVL